MNASGTFQTLKELITRLVRLYLESAKLTLAEKMTLLLSAALILIIVLVLGIFALAFFAGAAVEALQLVLEPWLSNLLLGGFFLIIIMLVFLLRKPSIINPIAKFLSRLMFESGNDKH